MDQKFKNQNINKFDNNNNYYYSIRIKLSIYIEIIMIIIIEIIYMINNFRIHSMWHVAPEILHNT